MSFWIIEIDYPSIKIDFMDVSVIIINYNTKQMTSECIASVIENTRGVEYEILLVDNASTDGSKEFFENDKRVKYIYSEINGGFGAGNNIGVRHACGKYIFFLNSDTLLMNNAIKMFYDFSESQKRPCVCGSWLVDRDGNPNVSVISFPRMNIAEFIKSKFKTKRHKDYSKNNEVDAVCGADMFLPKFNFNKCGGFDENIFMYGDEIELQYRLMKNRLNRYIINGPKIIHYGGGSATVVSSTHYRSHFYFLKKHMSTFNYLCARSYYVCNYFIRRILGKSSVSLKDILVKI